jgi:hypothetical protein
MQQQVFLLFTYIEHISVFPTCRLKQQNTAVRYWDPAYVLADGYN